MLNHLVTGRLHHSQLFCAAVLQRIARDDEDFCLAWLQVSITLKLFLALAFNVYSLHTRARARLLSEEATAVWISAQRAAMAQKVTISWPVENLK